MAKAFSYIRFSTPEQAKGDSLRRQLAAARAWCEQQGLELDDSLRDLGVSAYKGANRDIGALRSFLTLVESGDVPRGSFLVVESLDRLSREAVLDAAARLFDLIRAGVTVVTLSDGQVYSEERLRTDWTPLIVSIAVMARAHEESRTKGERVGAAWGRKKAQARAERKPLTSRCPEWLRIEGEQFVVREDRAQIVRRIFGWTIEGAGRREIVRRLNLASVPPFRGGAAWHTSSVAKIQQSRAVLGEYQPHIGTHRNRNRRPDGEPVADYYPAIVSTDTYWRAQGAFASRRQGSAGRKGERVHLLQGVGRCGACGSAMHIVNKARPPKGAVYLACSSNIRSAGCDADRRWRVDRLEELVLDAMRFVAAETFTELTDEDASTADRLASLAAALSDAETRRTRLLALVETGDEAAVERFRSVSDEVRALRKEHRVAESADRQQRASPGTEERLAEVLAIAAAAEGAQGEEQRRLRIGLASLIKGAVERVDCHGPGAVLLMTARGSRPFQLDGTGFALRTEPGGLLGVLLEGRWYDENPKVDGADPDEWYAAQIAAWGVDWDAPSSTR